MISVLMQVIGATIGTIAFSLLYGVPKKYYPCCGIVGGVGWLVYLMAKSIFGTALGAFFSAIAIVLLSRLFAVRKHCPVTIFLIAGIFPLVPGAGICMTSYYIVLELYQGIIVDTILGHRSKAGIDAVNNLVFGKILQETETFLNLFLRFI